jgi:hypothetical protein
MPDRRVSSDKDKPLVEMDDLERVRAWDDIHLECNEGLLVDARTAQAPLRLAAAILVLPSGDRRVVFYTPEYGDNEGLEDVGHFLREVRRTTLLQPGESLERVLIDLPAVMPMRRVPLKEAKAKPKRRVMR